MAKKGGTVESVQALRAAAAVLVGLFHCQLAYVRMGRVDAHSLETYLFAFGAVGVHIFFVISGFIMVATNPDPDRFRPSVFYWHRLVRIYPIYWIFCALALPLHASEGGYTLSFGQIISALVLSPTHAATIIGSGWTLPYELFFYLCFGLALAVFRRYALPALTLLFLACTAMGAVHHWQSAWMHLLTNPLLIEFLFGAAVAKLAKKDAPRAVGIGLSLAAVAIFAAGLVFGYHRLPSLIVWGVPSGMLVLGLIWLEKAKGAGAFETALGRLGDSSYVLYLLHPIIIGVAIKASILSNVLWLGPISGSILIVGISVVLAHIAHLTIEAPILRWLRAQWPRRKPTPPAEAEAEPALV